MDAKRKEQILTLSASKIGVWKTCPMLFFLQYIEHVKAPPNIRFVFGKAIHTMLNKFYKVDFKSSETFAKFWKGYWSRICNGEFLKGREKEGLVLAPHKYVGREITGLRVEKILYLGNHIRFLQNPVGEFFGYMKLGEKILRKFYLRHKNQTRPLEREKRRTVNLFGHKVIAIFDRIDLTENGLYICDYKTDKKCPDQDSFVLHRNPQFTLYSKAFRILFGEEDAILYYHLRSGKVLKTKRSERDFEYLEQLLNDTAEGIENALNSGFFVPYYSHLCDYCDYKIPCEDYSISYDGPKIAEEERIIGAKHFTEWYSPEELPGIITGE